MRIKIKLIDTSKKLKLRIRLGYIILTYTKHAIKIIFYHDTNSFYNNFNMTNVFVTVQRRLCREDA